MANKWIALNILLLIAAVGIGRELYQRYEQFKTINDPARIESVSTENQAAAKNAPGASMDASMEKMINTGADYFIISEKTLFSDLRGNDEGSVSTVAPKVAPLPNPKPVLVGVTVIDGEYTASVMNQPTPQQRGGQAAMETWRVGDFYRGYMVTSIESDQIVLENSGAREVLQLNRTARRTTQQTVRPPATSAASIVSIGPAGGSSGAITVSTASSAAAPGRGAAPTAAQNTAARQAQLQQAQQQSKPQQQQAKPQQQQAKPQRVTVSTPDGELTVTVPENVQDVMQYFPAAQKPQPGANANPAQGGRQQPPQRTVPTPFGEIIRPGSE